MPDPQPVTRWDAGLALGLLALTAAQLVLGDVRDGGRAMAVAALVVAASLVLRRRAPLAVAGLAAAACVTAFALGGVATDVPDVMGVSLAVVAFGLGDRLAAPGSAAAAAVLLLCTYGAQLAADGGNASPPLLFVVLGPALIGGVVRSQRTLAAELTRTARALELERAAYVELAVERERRAIARDLHDVVGHAMSLIVIQAAAGRHLAADGPAAADAALEAILDAGHLAEVEVRRLRGLLAGQHSPGAPGLDRVPLAVARASAAGLVIRVTGSAARVDLDPDVDRVAYRVVQEALTNVITHAWGGEVALDLRRHGDRLAVCVRSAPGVDAAGAVEPERRGLGLRGLREQVEAAGGRLRAGPAGDGWEVFASLPCRRPASTARVAGTAAGPAAPPAPP